MRYLTIIFIFLSTFATAQQSLFLRSTPAAGGNLLLDDYPGAVAAYATVKLRADADSCMVIRRDSDDALALIGFSGNDIDEAAISSHCSGANCFVARLSDQSGSGVDLTQGTTDKQPKIYDSSTGVIRKNGVAAMLFDGTNDNLNSSFPSANSVSEMSVYCVATTTLTNTIRTILAMSQTNGSYGVENDVYILRQINGYFTSFVSKISGSSVVTLTENTNQNIFFSTFVASNSNSLTLNSSTSSTDVTSIPGTINISGVIEIGSIINAFLQHWAGTIQLCVVNLSDQSTNQAAIENEINNYFNIFYINILILLVRLPKRKEKNAA